MARKVWYAVLRHRRGNLDTRSAVTSLGSHLYDAKKKRKWDTTRSRNQPGRVRGANGLAPLARLFFFRGLVVVVVVIVVVVVVVFAPGCICIPGQIGQKIEKLACLAHEKAVRREGRGSTHRSALCLGRTNDRADRECWIQEWGGFRHDQIGLR